MLNLRSSASARIASLILRPKLRLLVRKMLRASCWVMVEVALHPVALGDRRGDRAADPDRIDADVAAEAAVLGRDHRRAHFRRDLVVGQPLAEARPDRDQDLAVGGADPDHLPEVAALGEIAVARQIGDRDRDRDDQRQHRQQRRIARGP